MTRFFFDLHDNIGHVVDEEGREFPSLEAARQEAVKGVRSIISAEVGEGVLDLTGTMVVRDADGTDVLVVPFEEVLSIMGRWTAPGSP
nr:hypothetical protein [uncultured Sphingosinicella sp.]